MPKGGQDMKKIVVTVIGADRVGIVAGVTKELAKRKHQYSGYFPDHSGWNL